MHKITCPACGYHVANLDQVTSTGGGAAVDGAPPRQGRAAEVGRRVAEWLTTIERGRYLASDLIDAFTNATGESVTAKEFGTALRSAGAVSRRGARGVRTWEIHGGTPDFGAWLLDQTLRADPVGDLARDYRDDPSAGSSPQSLARRLDELGAGDPVRDALRRAATEWRTHRWVQSSGWSGSSSSA